MRRDRAAEGLASALWGAAPAIWCSLLQSVAFTATPVIVALGICTAAGLAWRGSGASRLRAWKFLLAAGWLPLAAVWAGAPGLAAFSFESLEMQQAWVVLWTVAAAGLPAFLWGHVAPRFLRGEATAGAAAAFAALAFAGAAGAQAGAFFLHAASCWFLKAGDVPEEADTESGELPWASATLGAALGLTLAAGERVLVVASSGWALAGVPLWAGALAGAAWKARRAAPLAVMAAMGAAALAAHAGWAAALLWENPRNPWTALAAFPVLGFAFGLFAARGASPRGRAPKNLAAWAAGGALGLAAAHEAAFPFLGSLRTLGAGILLAFLVQAWPEALERATAAPRKIFMAAVAVLVAAWCVAPFVSERRWLAGFQAPSDPVEKVEARYEDGGASVWVWRDFGGNLRLAVNGRLGYPYANPYFAMAVPVLAHGEAERGMVFWPTGTEEIAAAQDAGLRALSFSFPSRAWEKGFVRAFSDTWESANLAVSTASALPWATGGQGTHDIVMLPYLGNANRSEWFASESALRGVTRFLSRDGLACHPMAGETLSKEAVRRTLDAHARVFPAFYRWRLGEAGMMVVASASGRPWSYKRLVGERLDNTPLNRRFSDSMQSMPFMLVMEIIDNHEVFLAEHGERRAPWPGGTPHVVFHSPSADPGTLLNLNHQGKFRLPLDGVAPAGAEEGGRVVVAPLAAAIEVPPGWSVFFTGVEWFGRQFYMAAEMRSEQGAAWGMALLKPSPSPLVNFLEFRVRFSERSRYHEGSWFDKRAAWALEAVEGRAHAVAAVACPVNEAVYLLEAWTPPSRTEEETALYLLRRIRWECLAYE